MSRNFLRVFEAKTYDLGGGRNPLFPMRPKRTRGWFWPIVLTLFGVAGFGTLGWLVFGPQFRFTDVQIQGLATVEEHDVRQEIDRQLAKHILLLPRDHEWFFSTKKLTEALLENYPLQSVSIERQGKTLLITVVENVNVLALRSGETVIFIDRLGRVVREADPLEVVALQTRLGEVTPSTEEQGSLSALPDPLPILQTPDSISVETGSVIFQPIVTQSIVAFDEGLRLRGITPHEYIVDHLEEPWFHVTSDLQYQIYFDPQQDIEQQLTVLQVVMKEYEVTPPTAYIDVRFGDRAFVK